MAASIVPVSIFTLKVAVFILAVLSFITGNIAWRKVKKQKESGEDVMYRQFYHVFFNALTVIGTILLIVGGAPHTGFIAFMFAVAAYISGTFTYRSIQVQWRRGDDELDKPSIHALSSIFLIAYIGYSWVFQLI
ncbi:MAG: hypothetical protein ABEK59_04135 [Halobacteria archaeon]